MSDNEFTCSQCGGTFEKARSDEEAMEESRDQFGQHENVDVVCDDCFQAFMGWWNSGGREKCTS